MLETADGHALGTLCILDRRPRDLDAKQRAALAVLADQVMALLEAHRGSLAQRRLVRALDAALSARSRLLATVAHDLRSPLSVVEMSVPILRDPTSAHQTKTLDRIERAAVSMHRLVDDLLDVEHFAAGTVALTLEPLELSSVVEAAVDSFSLAARAGSIELRAERPEGEQRVVADRGRVHQVLANLIGNAIRFTPAGGSITIRIEPLPGYVRVSVDDTGAGLSADERTKVFEPFWRGGNTADKGAGLGLAISRTIVEAHGGTIGVSSEPGEGASFSFTLRRADVSA